ncbi:hypothetical protein D2E25_0900 [Bifidobacterium goeldii]|uniref:Toxin n=1 Tax=Bifidobacterium goeldii TaxID=2306975 RepID=A0A430FL68_9BIFI|nr:hypothetical protein [Bifidobacterium goeldii]RSX53577.1 hypothetical protein D2E25_0900 [Bifidobacterium goeldii]
MEHTPNEMYDKRHTSWYNHNQTKKTIDIHPHALMAHELTKEQIESAFATRIAPARIRYRDHNADPARWAAIGLDLQGRPIELVYIKTADQAPLVIHANYLTKGFFKEWRQA